MLQLRVTEEDRPGKAGSSLEGRVKSQRRLTAEADRLAEADIKTVKQIKLPC